MTDVIPQFVSATKATDGTWRPLLAGQQADQAHLAIRAIADELHAAQPLSNEPSACHYAELALFYTYLERAGVYPGAAIAERCIDQAFDAVAAQRLWPALYGGFTGVGWVIAHVLDLGGNGMDDDPAEAIDAALLNLVCQTPWRREYDLISGLVGFGVYAQERLPRLAAVRCLEQIVARLAETAERRADGATWWTDPRWLPPANRAESPRGYYNLGLAHGVPGVIGLLGGACAAGVAGEVARPLLDQAVAWLLSQRLPAGEESWFGYWIAPDTAPYGSRLAWCYGDLGLATALLYAARCVDQPEWERVAVSIASAAAARPPERAGVVDAGLCHGSAGIAHLFNRLYQATGHADLAEAARLWYMRTLAFQETRPGVAGFAAWAPSRAGEPGWVADPSFLCGAAGIGLALLGAITPVAPNWDRMLMAAIPPRER